MCKGQRAHRAAEHSSYEILVFPLNMTVYYRELANSQEYSNPRPFERESSDQPLEAANRVFLMVNKPVDSLFFF